MPSRRLAGPRRARGRKVSPGPGWSPRGSRSASSRCWPWTWPSVAAASSRTARLPCTKSRRTRSAASSLPRSLSASPATRSGSSRSQSSDASSRPGSVKTISDASLTRRALWCTAGSRLSRSTSSSTRASPPGENHDEKELTARALDWPLGRWLVAAAGLVVVGVGLYNIYRGLSQDFRDELKEEQMKGAERRGYSVLGLIGFTARGVIFVLAGFFVVRAAWQYDPKEAAGLDGALARLAHAEYGMFLLACVAAGLLAYALFSFAQARYRKV